MKKQVEELKQRVRLTPEEKMLAKGRGHKKYNKQTPSWKQNDGDRFEVVYEEMVEAQLNKVLSDPALLIEDTEKKLPEIMKVLPEWRYSEYNHAFIKGQEYAQQDMLKAGLKPVIRVSEAMEGK